MWPRHRPEPATDLAAALASLDRLAADRPELAAPARTLALALAAAFDRPAPATLDAPADAPPPVFRTHPPTFDPADLRRRAAAVCRSLETANPAARPLRAALDAGALDLAAHLAAIFADHEPSPLSIGLDTALVESVARLVALPSLATISNLRSQISNRRFTCDFCGSPPLLAEARGLEQHRILRCGLCAAAWPMPRLDCPACAAAKLGVFHVEGEQEQHRLLACPVCGLRIKLVTTLGPLTPPALLAADLATVHLDLIDSPSEHGA
jgi:transcription elongation factor Elf1